jgi:hypothetical protein
MTWTLAHGGAAACRLILDHVLHREVQGVATNCVLEAYEARKKDLSPGENNFSSKAE